MPQLTEEDNMPPEAFCQPSLTFHNSTIRQTLRITTGGQHIRVRISNTFGLNNLEVTAVTISLPKVEAQRDPTGSRTILTDTVQALTFGGQHSINIPNGALAVSDPVKFPIQPAQVITISIYLEHGQTCGRVTGHPGSRTQTWMCHGDFTKAEDMDHTSTESTFHWYYISSIEAWQPKQNCAMVLIGDSLTDGRGSTDNANDRWPDLLFDRMLEHLYARNISVLNQAAGGNRILEDEKGPNVLSRLDRDIFTQPGVRYVMIFHGVNDIGTTLPDATSQQGIGDKLIIAYKQIISRVHTFGIPVFASTIGPFMAPESAKQPYSVLMMEKTRQRINAWIRESGAFDAVIDFDVVLRDPGDGICLNPEFNSGDYLHPNVEAYHAMAEAFPLGIFEQFADGVHKFD
ncbi:SGNH hydrolase [Stipitochalara longipes BDJ]|nr:SGNH hydrolase [Stipitochalara longipes BDJ]